MNDLVEINVHPLQNLELLEILHPFLVGLGHGLSDYHNIGQVYKHITSRHCHHVSY